MSKNNPLEGLPVNGVYPLSLSTAFKAAVTGKGGKEDVIGMKYAFKPESITPDTEGRLDMNKGRASQLSFDTKKGSQVFDIRDEPSAARECVVIWNPETVSFTIHPLPTTFNLTLNRNLSGQGPAPAPAPPPPVVTKRKADPVQAKESPKKKSRPSSIIPEPKKTGGKTLPKKSIPAPVPVPLSNGKIKSAEIIDESESEEEEEEEEDDFAALLGAEMAKGEDVDEDQDQEPMALAGGSGGVGAGAVGMNYEDDSSSGEEEDDDELI